jgi:hypothetical protein
MREIIHEWLDEMIEASKAINPAEHGVTIERKNSLLEFLYIIKNDEEHAKNFVSLATSLYVAHPEIIMFGAMSAIIRSRREHE